MDVVLSLVFKLDGWVNPWNAPAHLLGWPARWLCLSRDPLARIVVKEAAGPGSNNYQTGREPTVPRQVYQVFAARTFHPGRKQVT